MVTDTGKIGTLRAMMDSDRGMVLAWRNQPAVRKNMYTQQIIPLEAHQNWWARTKDLSSSQYLIFEVGDQPLGAVNFTEISPDDETAFWGFYTAPDAPKGTGTGLGLAALDYGFSELGLRKLCAEVLAYNAASLGFHRKLGFAQEGVFAAQRKIGGRCVDVYRFAAFAVNWAEKRVELVARIHGRG